MVAEKKKENKGKGDKRQREGEDEDREAPLGSWTAGMHTAGAGCTPPTLTCNPSDADAHVETRQGQEPQS